MRSYLTYLFHRSCRNASYYEWIGRPGSINPGRRWRFFFSALIHVTRKCTVSYQIEHKCSSYSWAPWESKAAECETDHLTSCRSSGICELILYLHILYVPFTTRAHRTWDTFTFFYLSSKWGFGEVIRNLRSNHTTILGKMWLDPQLTLTQN